MEDDSRIIAWAIISMIPQLGVVDPASVMGATVSALAQVLAAMIIDARGYGAKDDNGVAITDQDRIDNFVEDLRDRIKEIEQSNWLKDKLKSAKSN